MESYRRLRNKSACKHNYLCALVTILGVVSIGNDLPASEPSTPDFNREVRPILADYCFKCHGPDDSARQAGLRLDQLEGALGKADSGLQAVVPGDAKESELVRRIYSEDDAERMPPPETNKSLSDIQKQILRDWVASGAEYRSHWAFTPPKQAPLPAVKHATWPRNAIDYFVLARLEAEQLTPSPPADSYTLVRRVYLDLVGLPPTPTEADLFVHDESPDAYDKLVDRLLESPHYGERWTRLWLDLARYADSNGYDHDDPRSIWPYRDWVIHALNTDMRFDQFTIEQIAGDMLPNATIEQRIATGFHRNTQLNVEGGIDPLEYRFYSIVDRVNTTATTWLGLTLGCAQCHTHKYDPIPQRDYYCFMALLNNTEEPWLTVPKPDVIARRGQLEAQIAEIEAGLASVFPLPTDSVDTALPKLSSESLKEELRGVHLQRKFEAWRLQAASQARRWSVLRPTQLRSNLPLLTVLPDDSVLASGDQTKSDAYDLEFLTDLRGIKAFRLEVLPHEQLPGGGPGRTYYAHPRGEFYLNEFTLLKDGQPVTFTKTQQTCPQENGKVAAQAIDGDLQTGWLVTGDQIGRENAAVFELASPLESERQLQVHLLFDEAQPCGLGRFRLSVTTDVPAKTVGNWPSEIEFLLTIPPELLQPEQRKCLFRYYLSVAPELAEQQSQISKLRAQMPTCPTTLALEERPIEHTRPTYLHHRGEFLQPVAAVEPDVLSILPPLPEGIRHDRLALARWLVAADNPLVARVTMNRQWAAFFGCGIVNTPDDFGYQSEPPSHPELLDWLAKEFVNRNWSLKQMHRLIVTSSTYRQASHLSDQLLRKDPDNRLLARGPRNRLDAELIRDAVLMASGLLSSRIGGPSVFPPQPSGVTTEGLRVPYQWVESKGEDRYRRGVYTFQKRNAAFAMFSVFDAPNGTTCTAKRQCSTSPLQALTLLNDPMFIEAAKALGRETAEQMCPTNERVTFIFRRCLTRQPTDAERAAIIRFYDAQTQRIATEELSAKLLIGSTAEDMTEQAAWATVARCLLNLDEVITGE